MLLKSTRARHTGALLSLMIAAVLTVSVVAPVAAWQPPAVITSDAGASAFPQSTAVGDGNRVHFVYTAEVDGIRTALYRSSADRGITWTAARQLSSESALASASLAQDAGGMAVDVVLWQWDADANHAVWYRRSVNNGADWDAPKRITPSAQDAGKADVDRNGSRVTIIWTDRKTGKIFVRISNNGGLTFASRRWIGMTANRPYPGVNPYDGYAVVGDAAAVLNAAWQSDNHSVRTKRSLNNGAWWTPAVTLASNSDGSLVTMFASSARVMIGYTSRVDGHWRATQRRSYNSGARWYPALFIGAADSFAPILVNRPGWGGGIGAAYSKCTAPDCSTTAAFFRWGGFSGTWSKPDTLSDQVSPVESPKAHSVGLAVFRWVNDVVVMYDVVNATGDRALFGRNSR